MPRAVGGVGAHALGVLGGVVDVPRGPHAHRGGHGRRHVAHGVEHRGSETYDNNTPFKRGNVQDMVSCYLNNMIHS